MDGCRTRGDEVKFGNVLYLIDSPVSVSGPWQYRAAKSTRKHKQSLHTYPAEFQVQLLLRGPYYESRIFIGLG